MSSAGEPIKRGEDPARKGALPKLQVLFEKLQLVARENIPAIVTVHGKRTVESYRETIGSSYASRQDQNTEAQASVFLFDKF